MNGAQIAFIDYLNNWKETLPGVYKLIPAIGNTILAIIVAKILLKISINFIKKLVDKKTNVTPLMGGFMIKTLQVIVWSITAISILGFWGIDIAPILAGVGVSGIVLGLALQETIASIFSGFMIAVSKPFGIGDYVEIGSVSGTVSSMDTVAVGLVTPDGKKIVMANKLVWGAVITNYSSNATRRIDMALNISYDVDINRVKEIAREILVSYPDVLENPAPVIEVGEYADSFMKLYIRPYCKNGDYWKIKFRFQADLPKALSSAGIKIPRNKLEITNIEEK
ncbi:MAG: mechanosensitive ion channel family protein [Spirochaetales bacterium]|nr:mechanosensitive ion channel family protein [Spirochaetales bacterium]